MAPSRGAPAVERPKEMREDIAVDGWALTMLRKENAGYASTCAPAPRASRISDWPDVSD